MPTTPNFVENDLLWEAPTFKPRDTFIVLGHVTI